MAQFYFWRIREGKMTIDEVPSKWKKEVKALIKAGDK